MRLAAYTDYVYRERDGEFYSERAFALFLAGLASRFERMVVLGRLAPGPGNARYPLTGVRFVPLPYYRSLSQPLTAGRAIPGSLRRFWATLSEVDCVLLLGPHPLAILFALIALLRRRSVVLGLRQDLLEMTASRHSDRPSLRLAARVLEGCYRLLARWLPTMVVGPKAAASYRHSRSLLEIAVSLVRDEDIAERREALGRTPTEPLTVLSVGRLDAEKNPLLLADALAALRTDGRDWRLLIHGEGDLADQLSARLRELRVDGAARIEGYVPLRPDLLDQYRSSDVFLHVSWTEGLPQVLIEAAASGLPIVATDVGGVGQALAGIVRLIPPGDATSAADAVRELVDDPELRGRLVAAGLSFARDHTLDAELDRVAEFIRSGGSRP